MNKIKWATLLHIYQPPHWDEKIIKKVARESYRPIINILKKRPKAKITLNISGSLTEQLAVLGMKDILNGIKALAERGQIEFTGSAKYHVILPKLSESEIIRQIRLNAETNRKYFGKFYRTAGFFPPEMCYSLNLGKILAKEKFHWVVLDEIAFGKNFKSPDSHKGYRADNLGLKVIFRNRVISDLFIGATAAQTVDTYKKMDPDKSPLFIAMDGEALGHHRPGYDKVFAKLLDLKNFETATYSEILNQYPNFQSIEPRASSWASMENDIKKGVPYELWDDRQNPIHRLQWKLYYYAIKKITKSKNDPNYSKARTLLDESINSDPFWWASAHPWWSVEIVADGANRLLKALLSLKSLAPNEYNKAGKWTEEIGQLARKWQQSGKAMREREDFLKKSGVTLHLGGKKV